MKFYAHILLSIYLWYFSSYGVRCQDELNIQELDEFLKERLWYEKTCILYHTGIDGKNVEKYLLTLTRLKKKIQNGTNSIKFYLHQNKNLNLTLIKCFVKKSSPRVFKFDNISSRIVSNRLYKWMETVIINSEDEELNFVRNINLDRLIGSKDISTFIVCLSGLYQMSKMERIFDNVKKSNPKVAVYFVPPGSEVERMFVEKYIVDQFPTVLFFRRPGPHMSARILKQLNGEYEATQQAIGMWLLLQKFIKISIGKNTLETFIRNKQYVITPTLITVFSSSDVRAYSYLHAFYRSYQTFSQLKNKQCRVNFFLLDISSQDNMLALAKHIQLYDIQSIPFLFSLQQNITGNHGIQQTLLETNGTPTPHVVEMFLQKINIENTNRNCFPILNRLFHNQCAANTTNICSYDGKHDEEDNKPEPSPSTRKQYKKKYAGKRGVLKEITGATWENNVLGYEKQFHFDVLSENVDFKVKLVLVIFISSDCSYCQTIFPEFHQVARSAVYIDNLSVFFMNCSKNVDKCKEYHVTGYPTLLLFRTIVTRNSENCFPPDSLVEPSWIDYHGNYEATSILSWISDVKSPALNIQSSVSSEFKVKNIKLVIKLFTKKYVIESLPRSLNGRVLHLSCLSILCEWFHSQLECIGIGDEGVEISPVDKNFFVSTVEFRREDGVRSTLMRTGFPMDKAIIMEDQQSKDVFHQPHKYNIPAGFSCEDDHRKCIDVIKHFIQDHARPPITLVTRELFHSHKKRMSYMWDRPILLALVHQKNLTNDTSFYKELYNVAVQLYTKVNVATLDIDEHSHWSTLFVPRGYYMNYKGSSEVTPLEYYPRFCLIHLDNHSRAAFYPRFNNALAEGDYFKGHVDGALNVKDILSFVDDYLEHGDSFTVESEHF